jgi:hypothetical protein
MNKTLIRMLVGAGIVVGMAASVFAGGITGINWDNDGSFSAPESPFYNDVAGTSRLAQGDLVYLVTLQGGTNYVLASALIGDGTAIDGEISVASGVASNVLQGAQGSPIGILFFNDTATMYGIVSNNTQFPPSPNWVTPPTPVTFDVDFTDANWQGPRTIGAATGGFFTDTLVIVPEPSTVMLVGIGLVSLWTFRRRKA